MTGIAFDNADQIRHAYIIASADIETSTEAAEKIAMAAVCKGSGKLPCGVCSACAKVKKGTHPDVKIIERLADDKGKQKREITVAQVREVSADAIVLPNESRYKVYIFREADCMNTEAQNAALKLLEEPPKGVILLLCVTNPSALLTTVRSRCVELNLYGEKYRDSSYVSLASEYLNLAAKGSAFDLWKWCERNNTLSVSEMAEFALCSAEMITDMLCGRKDAGGISAEKLMELEHLMEKCLGYLEVNVGVKQLFGLIGVDTMPPAISDKNNKRKRN
ncbi:MAG: hypothetical protein Q4F31_03205 [Eubacteriales bacterium]|nr:hypothetical protein [Eubacteriales bacterium]